IKAVGIESKEDIQQAAAFNNIDYILFDKKSVEHGGTGEKFDWTLLKFYEGETPFFLAGGIGPEDAEKISEINHPKFAGIDINSRFELSPGIKNIKQIKLFLEKILQ
ncbi:MAG TPA: phosphoribosylanthranilate isomerase, partial [Saprospiraceae bacterium]|nr:phosphoribosylanthranilate isomerase [Saprospiraceae bacterium]